MTYPRIVRLCSAATLTLALGACAGGGSTPAASTGGNDGPRSATEETSTMAPSPSESGSTAPRANGDPFCLSAVPASWKAAKIVEPANVVAMSATGAVRWVKPELEWFGRGSAIRIARIPAPGLGNAWLAGHHVAFERLRSEQAWGDWELLLWDSTTRKEPLTLDESDGKAPNAPFLLVSANDQALAWLHPLKDGRRQVRLHDVRTGRTEIVHVGHVGTPLIAGDLLMWPEASAPNTPPKLAAVDMKSRRPVQLPPQLADLLDPQEMSSDGRTFAWASADRSQLMAWQRGWPKARVIAKAAEGSPITWPKVTGDTVSWVADRTYTADIRSSSYVPMTKAWGGAETWGPYLHIGVPEGSGSSFHMSAATLPPLPPCK